MNGTAYVQFAYAASLLLLAAYAVHLWRLSHALERRAAMRRGDEVAGRRSARSSES